MEPEQGNACGGKEIAKLDKCRENFPPFGFFGDIYITDNVTIRKIGVLLAFIFPVSCVLQAQMNYDTDIPCSVKFPFKGTITDSLSGEKLVGVGVTINSTLLTTVTDIDGKFNLKLCNDRYTVSFSYIGYKNKNH